MKTVLINLALTILPEIIKNVSPILRDSLERFGLELYEKAKDTENPIDDVFALAFLAILGIKEPE